MYLVRDPLHGRSPMACPQTVGCLGYRSAVTAADRVHRHEEIADADLSGMSFGGFLVYGGAFVRCDFSEASFEQFTVGHEAQTRFLDCTFRRTRFPLGNTYFGNARFERCVFDGARLRDLRLHETEFVDCVFRGRVWRVIFHGALPDRAELYGRDRNEWHGNDFAEADLVDVDFRDIDLRSQRWPADRTEYALIDQVDERVGATLADAGDLSPDAVRALEFLHDDTHRDPSGVVLVRRRELGWSLAPADRDRLWTLLVENYRLAQK